MQHLHTLDARAARVLAEYNSRKQQSKINHPMTIGIAGLTLLIAAPAFSACSQDIDKLHTELRAIKGFSSATSKDGSTRWTIADY